MNNSRSVIDYIKELSCPKATPNQERRFTKATEKLMADAHDDLLYSLIYGTAAVYLPSGQATCPVITEGSLKLELLETIKSGTKRYDEVNRERTKSYPALKHFFGYLGGIFPTQYKFKALCRSCRVNYLEFFSYQDPYSNPVIPECQTCREKK
jgi:hypothetical protein